MKHTEPVTHLFLNRGEDGYDRYHVTVPVRVAEEIGADGIGTLQQFTNAIEARHQYADFEVLYVDGDELAAWKAADAKLTDR